MLRSLAKRCCHSLSRRWGSSSGPSGHSASDGRTLADFLPKPGPSSGAESAAACPAPYVPAAATAAAGRAVLLETYGCQMNVADMEVVRAVLSDAGFRETRQHSQVSRLLPSTLGLKRTWKVQADVVLLMTCAIREGAELKIRDRIRSLGRRRSGRKGPPRIGILGSPHLQRQFWGQETRCRYWAGCMAERVKGRLLEEEPLVSLVAGPDAYRDLPRLLAQPDDAADAVNVQLSLDETYADIQPIR